MVTPILQCLSTHVNTKTTECGNVLVSQMQGLTLQSSPSHVNTEAAEHDNILGSQIQGPKVHIKGQCCDAGCIGASCIKNQSIFQNSCLASGDGASKTTCLSSLRLAGFLLGQSSFSVFFFFFQHYKRKQKDGKRGKTMHLQLCNKSF